MDGASIPSSLAAAAGAEKKPAEAPVLVLLCAFEGPPDAWVRAQSREDEARMAYWLARPQVRDALEAALARACETEAER